MSERNSALHRRARERGVNPIVYWVVRAFFQPFFHLYFRLSRIGREHIPDGPVIFAANHRSFLDPFIIGTMSRRPLYYVAKEELFAKKLQAWFLNSLGAFPVSRGNGDTETIDTAKAILARGDSVLIFPEGTRVRPGPPGSAKRGVGRLVLETGVPVVPLAIIGTTDVRRGWRIRPRKIRIRAGHALTFPKVENASRELAAAVTDRIWPNVMLQWEWLGGQTPLRRAAVIGAGAWGTTLAVMLARAGLEVDLGTRTREQAEQLRRERVNGRYLPGVELPETVGVAPASELELSAHDLVCLAVPARALPAALAAHGARIPARAGVLVVSKGLVPPLGSLPSAFAAERVQARSVAALGGPSHAADALVNGASIVLASADGAFSHELATVLGAAGFDVHVTHDVAGVELAGCAKNAAVLAAAAAAATSGPNVAGAAAGKVFSEIAQLARRNGGEAETFAGLAGAGDLVATVVADGSRNRRAGELLAQGLNADEIARALGQTAESVDSVALLAAMLERAGVQAPATAGLAALVEGRIEPQQWTAAVTQPSVRPRKAKAA
ncbi:1-acyl-sn-glycerol-3-phosphate acyltransferase [Conexibacter stalactiti]|uniref:1-acyl-sn-glycerol-3-phosphate acyltransferase n=1 Tax=Conexibacter stalactiti TaxID=1940611 RepID=A0ABU4HXA7_9ACTN|nr:1-acyl-sn-glycerol-3-phosphate acyltransferase [Conexibacter stalactiti]MDW5597307.1 1-acyl-sn-glycerol-3-phosphate acyltransferase [Conexibacter stalactiti]MEC5037949.1 1-acyl-sn-glycerol-3-phosphate acyltransferase [Conexibacter stalactiti]